MERATNRADADLASVASLAETTRRALYRFVAGQHQPVTREQAANGLGLAHHVAKFHLDKLAHDGLLEVEYRRPDGRTGPGAGRPTKYYRRAERDFEVSLPPRRYEFAGKLMAAAISEAAETDRPVSETLRSAARCAGAELGQQANARTSNQRGRAPLIKAVCDVLDEVGYEPAAEKSCITLANCPFHALADRHAELVCGMNLDVLDELTATLHPRILSAQLTPAPGRCCVTLVLSRSG